MQRLSEILREMFGGLLPKKRQDMPEDNSSIDPIDPHGDGTVRPGDPMYDVMMKAMETGQPVVGIVLTDGQVIELQDEKDFEYQMNGDDFTDADIDVIRTAFQERRGLWNE